MEIIVGATILVVLIVLGTLFYAPFVLCARLDDADEKHFGIRRS